MILIKVEGSARCERHHSLGRKLYKVGVPTLSGFKDTRDKWLAELPVNLSKQTLTAVSVSFKVPTIQSWLLSELLTLPLTLNFSSP